MTELRLTIRDEEGNPTGQTVIVEQESFIQWVKDMQARGNRLMKDAANDPN